MPGGVNVVSALDHFWIIQFQTCHSMYNDRVWIGAWRCLPWVFGLFLPPQKDLSQRFGWWHQWRGWISGTFDHEIGWGGRYCAVTRVAPPARTTRKNNKDDDEAEDKGWSLVVFEMELEPQPTVGACSLDLKQPSPENIWGINRNSPRLVWSWGDFLTFFCPRWLQTNGCEVCWKSCMMPMILVTSGFKLSIVVWHSHIDAPLIVQYMFMWRVGMIVWWISKAGMSSCSMNCSLSCRIDSISISFVVSKCITLHASYTSDDVDVFG